MNTFQSSWFVALPPRTAPKLRLFCFPYAGGGASAFRHWCTLLPDEIELIAVQLPGRESRFGEAAASDITALIRELVEAAQSRLDIPHATFGHSLGTSLACEWALELARRGLQTPVHMIMSGRGAPHLERDSADVHLLPDAEFIQALREMQGTPEELLCDSETMRVLLPVLRADFALAANYRLSSPVVLPCGLSVYGGLADVDISRDQLQEWQHYASSPNRLRMFPGGHFFLHTARDLLVEAVVRDLYAARPTSDDVVVPHPRDGVRRALMMRQRG